MVRVVLAILLVMGVAAGCGGQGEVQAGPSSQGAAAMQVGPQDFAVSRCGAVEEGARCLIVQAGGKKLLFGAPEGAMESLLDISAFEPDAVFVTSLDPAALEGVARLRNESWRRGRTSPLILVGPDGLATFAQGLDQAFARPDAFVYVEQRPRGDFDAVLLAPLEVPAGSQAKVFDTGDLRVDGLASPASAVTYIVRYGGRALQVSPCSGAARSLDGVLVTRQISCEAQGNSFAWPAASEVIWLDR